MKKNILFYVIIILCFGCTEKFNLDEKLLFSEGYALPLIKAELNAGDIFTVALNNTPLILQTGNNGELLLSIQDTIGQVGLNDVITVESLNDSIDVPFNLFNFQREYIASIEMPFFSPMMEITEANISYSITFTADGFSEPMNFILDVPGIYTSDGEKQFDVILNGNQTIVYNFDRELIKPENGQLTFNIIAKPCRQTGVYQNYTGKLHTEVANITVHSITGRLHESAVPLENMTFELNNINVVELPDNTPTMHFIFKNDFSVSALFDVNILGIPDSGDTLKLTHPDFIIHPFNQQTSIDTITIDTNNSNIKEIFELLPESFLCKGNLKITPEDSTIVTLNETDSISVEYLVEFPSRYQFSTQLESSLLEVSESERIEDISEATLALEVLNEFPLLIKAEIILYELSGEMLRTIEFEEIVPAPIDENGMALSAEKQNIDRILSTEELNSLKETNQIIVKLELGTDNQKVVIKNDYLFNIKLALKAKN